VSWAVLREAVPVWSGAALVGDAALGLGGDGELGRKDAEANERRLELLARSRDGEQIELEMACSPFLQRDGERNRNCLRFRRGALSALGRSGAGTVFLRDHRQGDLMARGGTVLSSKMERGDGGLYRLRQGIALFEPWAVQKALTGSIDRFSIGWHATGPILCTACGSEVLDQCWHWPGDVVEARGEDRFVVEWEFQAAELVETSAVGVPAVLGTQVEEIRAALATALGTNVDNVRAALGSARSRKRPAHAGRSAKMDELMRVLGLDVGASEELALAAVEALKRRAGDAEKRLAATAAQLEEASAALARERATRETLEATAAQEAEEAFIRGGVESGKIRPGGKLEVALRDMFALDREAAAEMLDGAPVVTPVGAARQSDKPAPVERGGDRLTYAQLRNAGIDDPEAYLDKYGDKAQ
jgi:hypothetical protein